MPCLASLPWFALGAALMAATQPVPSDLSALAAAARLDRPVVGWCRGEFQSGHRGAYAVALSFVDGGGRYLVLQPGREPVQLALFTGSPEVACYTPAAARKLNLTIANSSTIQGRIDPTWTTTVVCGFVENTRALCWQYSPAGGAFVKVGEWTT